jgi:anti-anti-sigma factor
LTPHEISHFPQDLALSVRRQDGCTIVTISGELDIACAHALREQLLGVLGTQGSRLVADLSGVTFCDATGLSALTAASRRARLLGGVLCLAAPSVPVTTVLRLTGSGPQLGIFATVGDAISGLARLGAPRTAGSRHLPPGPPVALPPGALPPVALPPGRPVRPPLRKAAGDDNVRGAVAAVLAQADAWRDADPERQLTRPLNALALAHTSADRAGLVSAARSLLAGLLRHPLTHSPEVVATATTLRRLLPSGELPPPAGTRLSDARDAA